MGTPPSFSARFSKGDNFSWLPVCLPGGQSLPQMGSTLKGKDLLWWEQIRSFMRWLHYIWEATMKVTELLPLKVYIFTLSHTYIVWFTYSLSNLLQLVVNKGNNSAIFIFTYLLKQGQLFKLRGAILSFKSRLFLEKESNRKSWKLFPFVKVAEKKHDSIPMFLNLQQCTGTNYSEWHMSYFMQKMYIKFLWAAKTWTGPKVIKLFPC